MEHYNITSVTENVPCENCNPCLRLRLMDMGFVPGQKIELEEKRLGLWIVNMVSENGNLDFTDFIDAAYELDNEINQFESMYKIKTPIKAIPVSKDNKPANGHPGISLLAH